MLAMPAPRAEFWIIPDLLGCTLEEAEVAIRLVTDSSSSVTTSSMDASGQQRNEASQAHWRVCWQAPAVGGWIGPGSVVCFHVTLDQAVRVGSAGRAESPGSPVADRRADPPAV